MKRVLVIAILVFYLCGCKQIIDYGTDAGTATRYQNTPLYYGNFGGIHAVEDIPYWMNFFISYQASSDLQTPEECLKSGHGDCEEFSLLYLNIRYVVFHEKGELCIVDTSRTVEAGGTIGDHAVVRYGSKLIEPQTGEEVYYTVCYSYAFDDIFSK